MMGNQRMAEWDFNSRRGIVQLTAALSISVVVIFIYLNRGYHGGVHEFTLSENLKQKSCLSRDESSSYRKPSPHTPSPYLITKLKSYEALHRRCGPKTRHYRRSMEAFTSSRTSSSEYSNNCRYIIWTPSQGLGNQMASMVSAFLYALLTNRVLLVDFGPDLAELFCEPFPGSFSSWILPTDFPHKRDYRSFAHLPTFLSLMKKNSTHDHLPSFVYLNLDSGSFDRVNYIHCDKSHNLLNNIPVVVTKSDLYYAPSLFMTPSFMEELNRMFPEKTTVFHHLGRYLFNPSDQAWEHITDYYNTNLAKADVKVGLQIRVVNSDSVPHHVVMDQILSCTQNNAILPVPNPNHHILTNNSNSTTSVAVLVASLFDEYATNLTATYGSHHTTNTADGTQVIRVYQPSSDGQQKFHSRKQNMKAWVEMYLLSLSDKLVTTGESTFGYVAEGLSGFNPWVIKKPDVNTVANSVPCWRAPTIDPCFQFPPRYDCKAAKEVDYVTRLFPQIIRDCEDRRGWGIRLTDGD